MVGRVMSLNTILIMGVRPLGDFFAAVIISGIGGPATALASGAIVAAIAFAVGSRRAVRTA
jgi:hypothetical protein